MVNYKKCLELTDKPLKNEIMNMNESGTEDGTIDLRQIWDAIWQGKVIIISVTTFFIVAFVAVALYLNNTYQSTVLLSPQQRDESMLAGMSGQLKSLAGLAGASLGSDMSTQATLGIEVLKSKKFLSEFVNKHNLLVPLFASNGWDQSTNALILDDDIYDDNSKAWTRKITSPQLLIPGSVEIHSEFMKILSTSLNEDTGMITVSLVTHSPHISKDWLEWLIADLNEVIRKKDVLQAEKSITYLQEKIEKTQVAEIRNIFFKLIETEQRKILMAETKSEYVFETLDPASLAFKKSGPMRSLIVIMGAFLGGFLGLLIVFIRFSLRKNR